MPTTDDGQGMMPLQQKGEHMGNSRYGGGINMNDKDYSKIGSHMSAGHLDSLKDIYGEARREQLYNPVVEDASALSMRSPLNEHLSTKQEAKLTPRHKAALHQEDSDQYTAIGKAEDNVSEIASNDKTSYRAKRRKTQRQIKKVDRTVNNQNYGRKDRMQRAETLLEREGVKKKLK